MGKYQSETANHGPGKPDKLSQHASTKLDMLSQHAWQKTLYKRAVRAQNSGIPETARIALGVRGAQYKKINRVITTTLHEARQGIRHEA